jgi:hypothetical protein
VEERFREGRRAGRHENPRGGLVAHQDRKAADVVEMGMRHHDGVDAVVAQILVSRQGAAPHLFGVHASVEDNASLADFEKVAVRPDFVGAVEEGESGGSGRHK